MAASSDDLQVFRGTDEYEHWRRHVVDQLGELRESLETMKSQQPSADAIGAAVGASIKAIMDDRDRVEKFWATGFQRLAEHGGREASQWIGKRIITALIGTVFAVCLVWLVKLGAFK